MSKNKLINKILPLLIVTGCNSVNNDFVNYTSINSTISQSDIENIQKLRSQKLNGEFKVNTSESSNASFPSIKADKKGNFVITWIEDKKIKAKIFYVEKDKKSKEIIINENTDITSKTRPTLIMNQENGDFTIAWNLYKLEKDNYELKLKRFSLDGKEKGKELTLNAPEDLSKLKTFPIYSDFYNTEPEHKFFFPTVDLEYVNKQLVLTWSSFAKDGKSNDIHFYILKDDETKGTEFKIENPDNSNRHSPKVALDKEGNFFITWVSYQSGPKLIKEKRSSIYGQLFKSSGEIVLDPIKINTISEGNMEDVDIECTGDEVFLVVWSVYDKSKYTSLLTEAYSNGIYAQKIKKDGTLEGINTQIVKEQPFVQSNPKIKVLQDNSYFFTWQKDDILKGSKNIAAKILNTSFMGREISISSLNYKNSYDSTVFNNEMLVVWDGFTDFDDISEIFSKKFKVKEKAKESTK